MRQIGFFLLLIVGMTSLADDSVSYHYYVPFPEKTFSGEWQYWIEAGTQAEGEHIIDVTGYSSLGMAVQTFDSIMINGSEGFQFIPFSAVEQKAFITQSLVFDSPVELTGVIWGLNITTGQLNSIPLVLNPGEDLVIPQIGTDYFTWKSAFSLIGIAETPGANTNLTFRFYDLDSGSQETSLWSSFGHLDYLRKTPYFDLFLGDLDNPVSASWGEVKSTNPDVQVAGYQTFTRVDGSLQTCSFALNSPALENGSFPIIPLDGEAGYSVTFTNPLDREVDVTLELTFLEMSEESDDTIARQFLEIVIPGSGRVQGILGSTWFEDLFSNVNIQPLRFSFKTLPNFELPSDIKEDPIILPNPIHALFFVAVGNDALGAYRVQPNGDTANVWLTPLDAFKRELVVQNIDNASGVFDLTVVNAAAEIVYFQQRELTPSGLWKIDDEAISSLFAENPDTSLNFKVQAHTGALTFTLLGQSDKDIAISAIPGTWLPETP